MPEFSAEQKKHRQPIHCEISSPCEYIIVTFETLTIFISDTISKPSMF